MNEDRIAYVNGEFVLEKDAVISIRDRGFLQGYSVLILQEPLDIKFLSFLNTWIVFINL